RRSRPDGLVDARTPSLGDRDESRARAPGGRHVEAHEELPVALGPEDRGGDEPSWSESPRGRLGGDLLEDLAVDGGIPDDAMIGATAAGLELRLDERDDRAA